MKTKTVEHVTVFSVSGRELSPQSTLQRIVVLSSFSSVQFKTLQFPNGYQKFSLRQKKVRSCTACIHAALSCSIALQPAGGSRAP